MKCKFSEWLDCGIGEAQSTNEVDLYLTRIDADDDDPLEWWKRNSTLFPKLAVLAKRVFCVPASNAASECTFSAAGSLISDRRTPQRVNDILTIHCNYNATNE